MKTAPFEVCARAAADRGRPAVEARPEGASWDREYYPAAGRKSKWIAAYGVRRLAAALSLSFRSSWSFRSPRRSNGSDNGKAQASLRTPKRATVALRLRAGYKFSYFPRSETGTPDASSRIG
jgi:hypothetical protein